TQMYALSNSLSVDRFCNLQLESWLSSFNRQVQSPLRGCTPATAYYSCCLLPVKPVLTKLVSNKATLTVRDKTFIPVEKHFPRVIIPLFLAIFYIYLSVFSYIFNYLVVALVNWLMKVDN
ncbi:MAG: hypothetical protein WCS87_14030, partial [Methylococcaceae bacterium]